MASSSLTTRCAHCHTVFRVTTAQLQVHGGQVRCGRCMQVFDALAALAPEPAVAEAENGATLETASPAAAPSVASPSPEIIEPVPESPPEPPRELLPELQPVILAEAAPSEAIGDEGVPGAADAMPEFPVPVTVVDADNPFTQMTAEEPPVAPRRRLMAAASATLAVVLAAQAVFFYRSEVAARHPLAKQWLNWACAQAGCAVSLPQRPQSILIEASDLQLIDPANPNRIQLTATLRNHAGHDVGYPALDLVLTNVNDHTLARRIFLPEEYLGAGRDAAAGIAANAEMTVRLALETGNLGAAGFRLAVLPAPVR